jgi:hypothetical protein
MSGTGWQYPLPADVRRCVGRQRHFPERTRPRHYPHTVGLAVRASREAYGRQSQGYRAEGALRYAAVHLEVRRGLRVRHPSLLCLLATYQEDGR